MIEVDIPLWADYEFIDDSLYILDDATLAGLPVWRKVDVAGNS